MASVASLHQRAQTTDSRPLRVCFLIDQLVRAGTEAQLLELIRRLDRTRVEPILCLLDGSRAASQELEPDFCEVHRLGVRSLLRIATYHKLRQFRDWLRREQIDLLQVHFLDSSYFGVVAARWAGVPVVRTRRNTGYWHNWHSRLLGRAATRLSCGTIANCAAAKEAVIAQEGALPNSVVVIPNGIDTDRFAGIPDLATTWGKRPPRIGAVANLRDVKGLDIFVRAAAIVVKHYPAATFVVAGEGDQRGALEALIAELGLTGRFELPGAVNDIPRFLSELDVAVLCSQSEGLSNALLEYMAAGRAIVATAVGGNVELVRHEENGLLTPPNDVIGLSNAISQFLIDSQFAFRCASSARQKAWEEHSWSMVAARLSSVYQSIARDPESSYLGNPS